MQAGSGGERLLRETALKAQRAKTFTEGTPFGHGGYTVALMGPVSTDYE